VRKLWIRRVVNQHRKKRQVLKKGESETQKPVWGCRRETRSWRKWQGGLWTIHRSTFHPRTKHVHRALRHLTSFHKLLFSERELTFTFAICYRPSVCRLSSVTLVRPTQAVQIFGDISTVFGTLAILWYSLKISWRSYQGNPSAGGVKHKSGSQV